MLITNGIFGVCRVAGDYRPVAPPEKQRAEFHRALVTAVNPLFLDFVFHCSPSFIVSESDST